MDIELRGSFKVSHTVFCGDCDAHETMITAYASVAMGMFRDAGWTKQDGIWHCPTHSPKRFDHPIRGTHVTQG